MLCNASRQTKPWGKSYPKYPFVVRDEVVYKNGRRIEYKVALYKGAFWMPWEHRACKPLVAWSYAGWRQNTGKILLQFVFLLSRHNLPLELSEIIINLALSDVDFDEHDSDHEELFCYELGCPEYRHRRLAFKE